MASCKKFIPGSEADREEIFTYPFIVEDETVNFIKGHGKIMFIIRGFPGTGKSTLSFMLSEHYPEAVLCSADLFFTETFVRGHTKEKLGDSHNYCKQRVYNECAKGTHPVIVQNSHVKKWEMQNYLNFAAEFSYTVVVINTADKFKVTAKILSKSNAKGLKASYFERRLKQWENVPPVFTGWFICPEDCSYLLLQLQSSLERLLDDDKFCSVLNAFSKDELMKHYRAKELLCCFAGYGQTNNPEEIKGYYISNKVKQSYGRCFTIAIQAYLVTLSDVLALVHLDHAMNELTYVPEILEHQNDSSEEVGDIIGSFNSLSLGDNISKYSKTKSLSETFSDSPKTAYIKDRRSDETFNINHCSFIHLAENKERICFPSKLKSLLDESSHEISGINEVCNELENGFKVNRLANDRWLIKPPFEIFVRSIFTGLYN